MALSKHSKRSNLAWKNFEFHAWVTKCHFGNFPENKAVHFYRSEVTSILIFHLKVLLSLFSFKRQSVKQFWTSEGFLSNHYFHGPRQKLKNKFGWVRMLHQNWFQTLGKYWDILPLIIHSYLYDFNNFSQCCHGFFHS